MTGEPQNLHSLLLEAIRHLEHKLRCYAGAPDDESRRAILGPQQASYLSRYLSDLITSAGSEPFLPGEIEVHNADAH